MMKKFEKIIQEIEQRNLEDGGKSIDCRYITLYHGTNKRNLEKILKEGIKPRGRKKSNWENGNGISRNDLVYLTACYACYYASMACGKKDDVPVVIKLKLDTRKFELFPDEEYVFHATRRIWENYPKKRRVEFYNSINPLEVYFREHNTWKESLGFMGTVCAEHIPASCIVGYAEGDSSVEFLMKCDPSISPLNYSMMSEEYIAHLESLEYELIQ